MDFFIRLYREMDQDDLLKIWYSESIRAHSFIPAAFWEGHLKTLKEKYLPESKTFVAEKEGQVIGFISLIGNYVGALFVKQQFQGQGVGRALMTFAHKVQGSLFVDVYKQNKPAREFYLKYGFAEKREKIQPETGEALIMMYAEPLRKT